MNGLKTDPDNIDAGAAFGDVDVGSGGDDDDDHDDDDGGSEDDVCVCSWLWTTLVCVSSVLANRRIILCCDVWKISVFRSLPRLFFHTEKRGSLLLLCFRPLSLFMLPSCAKQLHPLER